MEPVILRGAAPAGSGYGYGYGDGDGSGYGYGAGDGDVAGAGNGNGAEAGDGYGDGDGDGYGDGSGYGYGYGYGDGYYWRACLDGFAKKWPAAQQERLATLAKAGATIAYWRSDSAGKACNGGRNKPVAPGTVETIPGPLSLCGPGALHATLIPPKWSGERWWIVALIGEVIGDDEKLGALTREVIGECT